MNVLITGGAGFIGFHVAKMLLERGDSVINIDDFNPYYDPKLKEYRNKILEGYENYHLYREDIANYAALQKIAQSHKIGKICHLAAQAGVGYSLKNPFVYEKTNILGTLNIFNLARECAIPQVVFASSSSVYGKNTKFPSSESDPVETPISLYAATKRSTELIAHSYHHLFGIKMTALRFFNVYGEFGRPDMMAWIFTEKITKGEPINVYNQGDTWKDYTYVGDIKQGIVAALDHPQGFEIVNLGNHTPVHLKHCIEIIEQEVGKKAVMNLLPLQAGDVTKSFADVSKAKQLFGWEPTTNMQEGLTRFVKWYKEYTLNQEDQKSRENQKKQDETRICIVGLGYVGLPLAVALGKHFPVTGFDINKERVEELKRGSDRSGEVDSQELHASNIIFTTDPCEIRGSNFIIVCVPTPIDKHKKPDLKFVESASKLVGENLTADSVIVFESTVYPGVTQEVCVPIIERASGLECGVDFAVGYSPERINPGDKENTIHTITKIVSGMDEQTLEKVDSIYNKITKTFRATSIKVAEGAKVIENIQRDLNIALMNELAIIFDKMNVNVHDVLEAAGSKWNFHNYRPGLVGGHCIGVDPYYLTYKAEALGHHPEVILAGRRINDNMHKFYAEKIVKVLTKNGINELLVLGLTFKPNVPDYRNSRVKTLIEDLKDYGVKVYAYDPYLEQNIIESEFGAQYKDPSNTSSSTTPFVLMAVEHDNLKPVFKEFSLITNAQRLIDL